MSCDTNRPAGSMNSHHRNHPPSNLFSFAPATQELNWLLQNPHYTQNPDETASGRRMFGERSSGMPSPAISRPLREVFPPETPVNPPKHSPGL